MLKFKLGCYNRQQQEYIHGVAWEGLDSRQLLYPFHNASVSHHWDGNEVEMVPADDSSKVSLADMNAWDAEGQEPISGIALEDCDRIEATKNGLRLVLFTNLTE